MEPTVKPNSSRFDKLGDDDLELDVCWALAAEVCGFKFVPLLLLMFVVAEPVGFAGIEVHPFPLLGDCPVCVVDVAVALSAIFETLTVVSCTLLSRLLFTLEEMRLLLELDVIFSAADTASVPHDARRAPFEPLLFTGNCTII